MKKTIKKNNNFTSRKYDKNEQYRRIYLQFKYSGYFTRIRISKFLDSISKNFDVENGIFFFKLFNFVFSFVLTFLFSYFIVAVVLTGLNAFVNILAMEIISNFLRINSKKKHLNIIMQKRKDVLYFLVSSFCTIVFVIIAIKKGDFLFQAIIN